MCTHTTGYDITVIHYHFGVILYHSIKVLLNATGYVLLEHLVKPQERGELFKQDKVLLIINVFAFQQQEKTIKFQ